MSLRILIGRRSYTGRLLTRILVEDLGVKTSSPVGGIVSYGIRVRDSQLPVLNANAGKYNKYMQLVKFKAAGLLVPRFWEWNGKVPPGIPVLGRLYNHTKGKDIVFFPQGIRSGADNFKRPRDYFVEYIPSSTEYRVWVFRDKNLGVYEKVLAHPEKKRRGSINRNHGQGWGFQLRTGLPEAIREVAKKALKAVDLDFGGVDILKGDDGKYYVLEVNSAPGVEGEGRQCVRKLAERIVEWEKGGYE
jgi:hypothetical protein